ncbi:MAG: EamA family transporter [Clostridia bacterium]|nr:EamA family transporter [Clostridia bacterium]
MDSAHRTPLSGHARGILCIVASAVFFGIAPSITALSYAGGNNPVNMAFLRALLPLPLFFGLARKSLPLPQASLKDCILLGVLSFSCTLLLYSSYAFIPAGIATTFHFLYPLYVVVYEAAARKQRPGKGTVTGLMLSLGGVFLFLEGGASSGFLMGLMLACLSGVCYAAYIIALEKRAERLPLFARLAGMSVAGAALCGAIAGVTGSLTLALTPKAWLFTLLAILLVAVAGTSLFQEGVRLADGTQAAMFSLFEPLTSILMTLLLSGETLSRAKLLGCVLILSGLALHMLGEHRRS